MEKKPRRPVITWRTRETRGFPLPLVIFFAVLVVIDVVFLVKAILAL